MFKYFHVRLPSPLGQVQGPPSPVGRDMAQSLSPQACKKNSIDMLPTAFSKLTSPLVSYFHGIPVLDTLSVTWEMLLDSLKTRTLVKASVLCSSVYRPGPALFKSRTTRVGEGAGSASSCLCDVHSAALLWEHPWGQLEVSRESASSVP